MSTISRIMWEHNFHLSCSHKIRMVWEQFTFLARTTLLTKRRSIFCGNKTMTHAHDKDHAGTRFLLILFPQDTYLLGTVEYRVHTHSYPPHKR